MFQKYITVVCVCLLFCVCFGVIFSGDIKHSDAGTQRYLREIRELQRANQAVLAKARGDIQELRASVTSSQALLGGLRGDYTKLESGVRGIEERDRRFASNLARLEESNRGIAEGVEKAREYLLLAGTDNRDIAETTSSGAVAIRRFAEILAEIEGGTVSK